MKLIVETKGHGNQGSVKTEDGKELCVKSFEMKMSASEDDVVNIQLMEPIEMSIDGPIAWYIMHPITGEETPVWKIVFKDGTEWPA